jgi:DHA2 family multidrug resistance protein
MLLALGLGSLQFVLDKGQREDWFSSSIIVTFSIIAVISLSLLVIIELYSKHPVVNLRLFKDRTYSMGNILMFFAFFNLFASIVLLPIFLQTLMNYTAFLAGVVLGPGGLATMVALPIAGKLVEKRNPKIILTFGIIISAYSTYLMSRFNLQTDFWTLVYPRVVLGIGMAFLFVPLTTLTLSHIPKERMTEATAMYNLLRNIGGSVGVAFVTTVLARRGQFHHFRLVEHLTPFDQVYQDATEAVSNFLSFKGLDYLSPDILIYGELQRQAHMLAFNDSFFTVSIMLISVLPLVLFMKQKKAKKA